ncbi:MAG: 2OG-Fe(II) oxygenase [Gammaproteobacteria bacterium]|nr:2OG-Fe(II) oxygenase [Gammaproteobacteria bacterium]
MKMQPSRLLKSYLSRRTNDATAQVAFVESLMSPDMCGRVIALAENSPRLEGKTGADRKTDEGRDSTVRFIWPSQESGWLFDFLEDALMKLNRGYGFELTGFYDGIQVATYEPGGHYDWHLDLGPGTYSSRKLSLTVQLSDPADYEGGELEFLSATDELAPRSRGSLIAFPSYLAHRVRPVTKGTRLSLVSWIGGPPFR